MAAALAQRLELTHIELDALAWGPSWTQTPDDELRAALVQAMSAASWVIDGNYSKIRDLVWASADTVLPLPVHSLQCADVIDQRQYAPFDELIGYIHLVRRNGLGIVAITITP